MEGASKQRPALNERQLAALARGRTLNAEARARREHRDVEREAGGDRDAPSVDPAELGDGVDPRIKSGDGGGEPGGDSRSASNSEPRPGGSGWRSLFGGDGAKPKRKHTRKTEKALDLSGVESLLLSIHLALSVQLASPELELTPAEAKRLGAAASEVARHYPIIATPKAQAWVQMMAVASAVYGPRGIAIWYRKTHSESAPTTGTMAAPMAAGANAGQASRPAATPSELDPLASLAGQTAVGAA